MMRGRDIYVILLQSKVNEINKLVTIPPSFITKSVILNSPNLNMKTVRLDEKHTASRQCSLQLALSQMC